MQSDEVIKNLLNEKSRVLGEALASDVIFIRAPMSPGFDDFVRQHIEHLVSQESDHNKLSVILETIGGSIETAERISVTQLNGIRMDEVSPCVF